MNQEENNQEREIIDFSDMLKSSETKFKAEQECLAYSFRPGIPKIVQLVIKCSGGLIKNEKQASYVLLGFVAVAVVIVLFLVFGRGDQKVIQESDIVEIEEIGAPKNFAPY